MPPPFQIRASSTGVCSPGSQVGTLHGGAAHHVLRDHVQVAVDGVERGQRRQLAAGVVVVVDGHRADEAAGPLAEVAVPGREVPPRRLVRRLGRVDAEHPSLALDVLLLHRDEQVAAAGGDRRAVDVGADVVVPHDLEVAAPHPVDVPGAGGDVDLVAERHRRGLEAGVAVVRRGPRVAEQQPLGVDLRLAEAAPCARLERVEGVEPPALHADVLAAVHEEAAAVHVAAVARRLRHRQAPELLAAAEGDGAVRRRSSGRPARAGSRAASRRRRCTCRRRRSGADSGTPTGCS